MNNISISKIDVDSLSDAYIKPPGWAKITARVNGVELKLTLNEEQTGRLIGAATPIVMELVEQVVHAMDRRRSVFGSRKQSEPAA